MNISLLPLLAVSTIIVVSASFGFMAHKHYQEKEPLGTILPFVINFLLIVVLSALALIPNRLGLLTVLGIMIIPFTTIWGIVSSWKHHRLVSLMHIPFALLLLYLTGSLVMSILILMNIGGSAGSAFFIR